MTRAVSLRLTPDTGTVFFDAALQHVLRVYAYAGLGMTASELAARYREYAAKCFLIAQRQEDASEKLALFDMAQSWMALAEQAEKNDGLVVVCETPEPKEGPKERS
jgi:hypothetical protein